MSYPPGPPSGGQPPGPPQWVPPGAPQPPPYGAPPPQQGYAPAPPGYGGPPTQPQYAMGPGGPPPKSNTGLILGIVIGLLVLGGGGAAAFFLLTGDNDAADTTTTLTTAITTTATTAPTTTSSPVTTPTTLATTTTTTLATTTTPATLATTTTSGQLTTTSAQGTPASFTSGAADVSWEGAFTGAAPFGFESSVDSGAGFVQSLFSAGDGSALTVYAGTPLAPGLYESTSYIDDPTTLLYVGSDGTSWTPDQAATGGACSINLGVADASFITGNFDCDTSDGQGSVLTLHGSFVATAGASATGLTGPANWTLGTADANWTGSQEDSGVFGFDQAGVASDAGDLFAVGYTDPNGAELRVFVGIPQTEGSYESLNYAVDYVTIDLTTDDGIVWIPDGNVADTRCDILIFYVNSDALAASFDCTLSNANGDDGTRLTAHGTVVAYNESMTG